MSMTDPIADMLTRIRNATMVRHDRTDVPASKIKLEVAKILKQEGFIRTFKLLEEGPQGVLRIYLKYAEDSASSRFTDYAGCRDPVGGSSVARASCRRSTAGLASPSSPPTGRPDRRGGPRPVRRRRSPVRGLVGRGPCHESARSPFPSPVATPPPARARRRARGRRRPAGPTSGAPSMRARRLGSVPRRRPGKAANAVPITISGHRSTTTSPAAAR